MKKLKSVDFDIQRFADEAANETEEVKEESVVTENADGEENVEFTDGAPITEETVEENEEELKRKTTKAFSERLKQEKKLLEQQLEEKKNKELDEIAKSRGFDNWKELQDYDKKEKLQTMGINDPDAFDNVLNNAISNNPIVQEAKQILEAQKQKEQEEIISQAVTEINKLDPDIKSIQDIIKLENYDEFYGLVTKGYSLPDAYKVVAFDKIAGKKADSAAQNVIRNIDSKGHLKTVAGNKTTEVVIPDEILASYKKNMPEMTDDEIRKHYNKFLNNIK